MEDGEKGGNIFNGIHLNELKELEKNEQQNNEWRKCKASWYKNKMSAD